MVKRVGRYDVGRTLGEGTFGKVKYAVNTETGEKVAIKILDKEKIQKQNMGSQIKKEISIMKVVKHANVVKLYEVLASRTKIFIVLELITGGELFDKIVAEGRFDENTARYYFRQLIKGVKYCHSQGVCHRDLKPENLLLDMNAELKISDFGLSALYTGSVDDEGRATLLHTTCGTPNYVAPEVLNDKGYDGRAADVWSCGVILYVLLAGFLPFDEPHMSALFRKIQKAEFSYPSWFTAEVRALLDKILVADPAARATIADIEADPWFIGPDGLGIAGADVPLIRNGVLIAGILPGSEAAAAAAAAAAADAAAPSGGGGGRAQMAHIPSAKDLDEAVQDIDDLAPTVEQPIAPASPFKGQATIAHDVSTETIAASTPAGASGTSSATMSGSDSAVTVAAGAAPQVLNAFGVINLFGGMSLNRLLDATDKRAVATQPRFLSDAPAATILARIADALTAMGAEVKVDSASCKVKGICATPKGEISIVAVVYALGDAVNLVEVRRGKGDILEFNSLHAQMRERTADLVTTTTTVSGPSIAR